MKYGITYMKVKTSGLSVHDWLLAHFDEAEQMLKIESCFNILGAETLLNKAIKNKRTPDAVIAVRVKASETTGTYQISQRVFCCVKHGCLTYPHCQNMQRGQVMKVAELKRLIDAARDAKQAGEPAWLEVIVEHIK